MCVIHAPVNLLKRFVRKLKNENIEQACILEWFCSHVVFCENGWGDGDAAAAAAAAAAALGAAQIMFFLICCPNGNFHEKIMKGKRPFGARFGFAFFDGDRSDCCFIIFSPNGDFD